ncbi:hypothetical protein [Pseudomonas sp. AN-1]|uniref:hypothetical protein n=1 Tax=Pseudomonas sp. AN-1 TaxID=3096605 RepID=UPI002A69C130|nr:hypothetical protein [Pseudomonas sp. AN-1]WPP47204.1 hypothetical protein SK095_07425 [Pseudomonas sp. AN-1]
MGYLVRPARTVAAAGTQGGDYAQRERAKTASDPAEKTVSAHLRGSCRKLSNLI